MILRNLKKTCDACPSSWEAVNEQGQNVYIRFRSDILTVHCPFNPSDDADYDTFMSSLILEIGGIRGDQYAGAMDIDEMLKLTGYTWEKPDELRRVFHEYLQRMGYSIDQTNPLFNELLELYLSHEWGEMVKAEFWPTWVWKSRVAEKLLEPFKVIEF